MLVIFHELRWENFEDPLLGTNDSSFSQLFYLLQEILDQIADIDLVVNFKCTEECLVKNHLESRNCSHGRDNAQKSSFADAENVWKEKLRIYAEQVFSIIIWVMSYMIKICCSSFQVV